MLESGDWHTYIVHTNTQLVFTVVRSSLSPANTTYCSYTVRPQQGGRATLNRRSTVCMNLWWWSAQSFCMHANILNYTLFCHFFKGDWTIWIKHNYTGCFFSFSILLLIAFMFFNQWLEIHKSAFKMETICDFPVQFYQLITVTVLYINNWFKVTYERVKTQSD